MTTSSRHGLLLDIQGSQSILHGERGIARYVMEHAMALMRRSDRVQGLLLNPLQPFPGHLPGPLLSSPLLRWSTASGLARESAGTGPLALHIMSPFELPDPATAVVPEHLNRPDLPVIVTLYDLIPYLFPDRYLGDPAWRKRYMQRVETIRAADLVLCISEATRQDAIRELGIRPDRAVNIQGGVSPIFRPADGSADPLATVRRAVPDIRGAYLFSVLGAEYRKNTERLIEAYASLPAELRRRFQLVITCHLPASWREAWMDHARRAGCAPGDVVLTGRVDDPTLLRLYQGASAFVFPSLYEGFGLPVAEAIAAGCPAITSNISSLPEILDHEAATFDPHDTASIAAVIERVLGDEGFRGELAGVASRRAPLFRWDAVADRTLEAVERVIDARPARTVSRARKPRVALVTPLPPERSGIADYSARIIPALQERMCLDVLHPSIDTRPEVSWPGVRILPVDGLGRFLNPHDYDAIVYAIGNSPVHVGTYQAMMRHPGIAWFHDVRLPHLYWHAALRVNQLHDAFIGGMLRRHYGARAPEHAVEEWSIALVDRFGLGLTPELVQRSRHVIVNSPFAERLLRLDQGPDAPSPPVSVLPLAAAPLRPGGPIGRPATPMVGSLGIVDERKGPLLLIDAVAAIAADRRPHLAFIGPCEPDKRHLLLEHAAARGLVDVEVSGWVDEADWQAAIDRMTCAVQLRIGTNGESAASIRDALAHGVPTITNMLGAAEEFPEGSVLALPGDVDAAGLATAIDEVCHDPAVWSRLSRAGWRYSEEVTAEVVASRLAEIVERTVAGPA